MPGIKSRMTCKVVKIGLLKTLTRTVWRVAVEAGDIISPSQNGKTLWILLKEFLKANMWTSEREKERERDEDNKI
jgi:hypothetical protein